MKHIPTMVTKEINNVINAYPTLEEVKTIVFELNGKSACGPDGFIGHFFQNARI